MPFGRNNIYEEKHYSHIERLGRRLNIINNEFLTQTRFALQSIFVFVESVQKSRSIHGTQRTLQAKHLREYAIAKLQSKHICVYKYYNFGVEIFSNSAIP